MRISKKKIWLEFENKKKILVFFSSIFYSSVLSNRPISSWRLTSTDPRPAQAGWLKNPRPLARGALSPAAYFMELENRNGANSPIASGLSVVAVPNRVQMRAASANGVSDKVINW